MGGFANNANRPVGEVPPNLLDKDGTGKYFDDTKAAEVKGQEEITVEDPLLRKRKPRGYLTRCWG